MSPIRVGIIGLGAVVKEGFSRGTWGLQHVKSLTASPHYEIVAVCNSSVESAQKSIGVHKLTNAKAYGSAEDIARDPNVDMVLVVVDCGKHYQLMKPALENGKDVYVEFPVAQTASQVCELSALAKKNGSKIVVGAQAQAEPAFAAVQKLVKSGEIGDLISSSMLGQFPFITADGWLNTMSDFLDVTTGINRGRGVFGHIVQTYTCIVGNFKSFQSVLKIQDKTAKLLDTENAVVDAEYPVTAPDNILLQGLLDNGAVASVAFRTSRSAIDDIGFRWIISGTKGEIELTTTPGVMQFLSPGSQVRIRTWGNEARVVELVADSEHVAKVTAPGTNVARLWEAFATGNEDGYPSIEDTVRTHELLETMLKDSIWAS